MTSASSPTRFRLVCLGALGALLIGFVLKGMSESRRFDERNRLVVSIVREQFTKLASPETLALESELRSKPNWPDEFISLETWLIDQIARGRSPEAISARLKELSVGHAYSPVLATSIARWQETLARWGQRPAKPFKTVSPEELILVARQRHAEAVGYEKIGRAYDAAALDLWSESLLTEFLSHPATRSSAPEALYLMGNSYFRLRRALPMAARSDRILNLCAEFFPKSIWGIRATELWRDGEANGA